MLEASGFLHAHNYMRTMSHSTQRAQLSKFLKNCRARVSPSDAGLPEPDRRRTAGLRREDVAALAGVSVTWYTWLEQGRDVHVSANVLERISSTLRLSDEERDYLFTLAQNRPPPLATGKADELAPAIWRMIEALDVPALVITLRWDVVAWNQPYAKAIRDFASRPADQRNLARILFTNPEYRVDDEEYDAMVHRVVPKLRVDYSQAGGDPGSVLGNWCKSMVHPMPGLKNGDLNVPCWSLSTMPRGAWESCGLSSMNPFLAMAKPCGITWNAMENRWLFTVTNTVFSGSISRGPWEKAVV